GSLGSGTLQLAVAQAILRRDRPLSFGPIQGRLRVSPRLDVVVDAFETRVGEASQLKASGRLGGPAALLGSELAGIGGGRGAGNEPVVDLDPPGAIEALHDIARSVSTCIPWHSPGVSVICPPLVRKGQNH
ncbi:MAG: hypothetical protein L0214_03560, partial [candidate division NC10 bacterium]|nr:hypothetical protein [candidate division NC10 bacterium]